MSRHRLGDMLDNLGQRIREFDNAYATRVRGMIVPETAGAPFGTTRSIIGNTLGYPATYAPAKSDIDPAINRLGYLAQTGYAYGAPVVSVAARYGLPTVGLTTAGIGLANLTGDFYDYASDQPVIAT